MEIVENKATTSKPRLFRWALWWGVGIVTICLVILIVYAIINPTIDEANSPMTTYFYALMYRFGIWPTVLYIGLIGPVIEEVSFRLWGNGKLWTGIVSVILMSVWSIAIGWWVALLTILGGTVILTVFNDDKRKRLFAMMLLSSVVFALAHMDNYNGNWFVSFIGVVHKLGSGLLASYLVINHNILWSIGLHIINNSLLALPMGIAISMASNDGMTIESESFRLEVRPVLVHNDTIDQENRFYPDSDTNYYFGSTASLAQQALSHEIAHQGDDATGDTINFVTENGYPKCSFTIVYKTQPFDHHGLTTAMEKNGLIKIDTMFGPTADSTHRQMKTLTIKSTYNP